AATRRSSRSPCCGTAACDRPSLGTIWGPHAMRQTEQPARQRTARLYEKHAMSWNDSQPSVLGVKGSPTQIRPSRLVVEFFRICYASWEPTEESISLVKWPLKSERRSSATTSAPVGPWQRPKREHQTRPG